MFAQDLPTIPYGRAPNADPHPASTWFEAPTPSGEIALCVTRGTTARVRHAADAAITLQSCTALLDALDDWIGFDLAWRWIDAPANPLGARSHVWVDWHPGGGAEADAAPAGAMLELPWALLRGLEPPPESLAQQLQWPEVSAAVVLSRLRVEAEALRALEPGGAVILPESMRPDWRGVLRAANEPAAVDVGVALDLDSPCSPRLVEGPARQAAAHFVELAEPGPAIVCEVRLGTTRVLGAECLAGWRGGELGEQGPQASLWRCDSAHDSPRCLASGRLMPWGGGWALALEAVREEAARAPTKD